MGLFLWSQSSFSGEWFFIFLLHLFCQGCTSRRIIETFVKGVPYFKKRFTKGEPFLSKIVCKT